jgi:23S rRNA (adenine2503-C2)-methyltransferase
MGSQVNLAVSLHAADDELRNVLVPINGKYPLRVLVAACRRYADRSRRRVTFEYALMDHVNDTARHARGVARLLEGMLAHVNLIPLNPTPGSAYGRSPYPRVKAFERILRESGIPATLRVEKGIRIAAGCGQLRQRGARTP